MTAELLYIVYNLELSQAPSSIRDESLPVGLKRLLILF